MDFCVKFNYTGQNQSRAWNVSPMHPIFRNETAWCNYTSDNISRSASMPVTLPPGIFFICGDWAWAGIPSHIKGGPCSLGRLSLLIPNTSSILQMRKTHSRKKRSTHAFTSECDDQLDFWNLEERITASFFVPGVAAAKALGTLDKLGCWLAKQTNATSEALSGLLLDVDSVRHATLQNRAAIDFLLLAQGHGCEDFEGMCCMNLSDHSESIHKSIQLLKQGVQKLQLDDGWDWLTKLLQGWGLGSWLKGLLQTVIILGLVFLCLMLCIPCFCTCLQNMIAKTVQSITSQALLAQKENGGNVESLATRWLAGKGHETVKLVNVQQYSHKIRVSLDIVVAR